MAEDPVDQNHRAPLEEKPFRFLDLPSELRIKVYEIILMPGRHTMKACQSLSRTCKKKRLEVQHEAKNSMDFYFKEVTKQFEQCYGFPLHLYESERPYTASRLPLFTVRLPLPASVNCDPMGFWTRTSGSRSDPLYTAVNLSAIHSNKIQFFRERNKQQPDPQFKSDSDPFQKAFKGLKWYLRLLAMLSHTTLRSWLQSAATWQPGDAFLIWEFKPDLLEFPDPLFFQVFFGDIQFEGHNRTVSGLCAGVYGVEYLVLQTDKDKKLSFYVHYART